MQTIALNFTVEALAVIDKGLRLVPYGEAAPVVEDINRQLRSVSQAPAAAADSTAGGVSNQTPVPDAYALK